MAIIVILGKTASGKDSVAGEIVKQGVGGEEFKYIVSTTSREKRKNEKEGVDYYYVTEKEFEKMIEEDKLIEYTYREALGKGTYYGLSKNSIEKGKNYVCVLDIEGVKSLKRIYKDVMSVYIKVPEEERKLRYAKRDKFEPDEWERRSQIEKEFDEYDYDAVIENYKLSKAVEEVEKEIAQYIDQLE